MLETILFFAAAGLAVGGALAVVLGRSPLRNALSLILTLCAVSMLYVLLHASFLAAMQVLVYAGAIMVLFMFVIMLLNLGPSSRRPSLFTPGKILGVLATGYVFIRVAMLALKPGTAAVAPPAGFGTVKSVGTILVTDYLFAFEAISILLLVAVVGAVVLGLKRLT